MDGIPTTLAAGATASKKTRLSINFLTLGSALIGRTSFSAIVEFRRWLLKQRAPPLK